MFDVMVIFHLSVLPKFAHLHSGGHISGTDIDSQACIVQHLFLIGVQQIDQWVKASCT